jgi:hypothetical protein
MANIEFEIADITQEIADLERYIFEERMKMDPDLDIIDELNEDVIRLSNELRAREARRFDND